MNDLYQMIYDDHEGTFDFVRLAYDVALSEDEQAALDALADCVMGNRYDEQGMARING